MNIYCMAPDAQIRKGLGVLSTSLDTTDVDRALRLSPDNDYLSDAITDLSGDQPGHAQVGVTGLSDRSYHVFEDNWLDASRLGNVSPPSAAWLPDGRRLVELNPQSSNYGSNFYGYHLILHSLDTPDSPGILLPVDPAVRTLLGVTPSGHLIATDFFVRSKKFRSTYRIFQSDLYPNPEARRSFKISLPQGAEVLEIRLAPKGDRLAWVLRFRGDTSFRKLLHRYAPALARSMGAGQTNDLWVSGTDGQNLHRIGAQPIQLGAAPDAAPHDVQWTPDGKSLSFLSSGDIYRVPAPY